MTKKLAVVATPVTPLPEARVMKFSEWAKIPPIKFQRNHEERIKENKHIRRFSDFLPTHTLVAMVIYPDGRRFKVDGHTRTVAWESGVCAPPSDVLVITYHVNGDIDARQIYNSIDNIEGVKNSADQIYSAIRELGMKPISALVNACKFGKAMNFATGRNAGRGFTKKMQVAQLREVLMEFDAIIPNPKVFNSSVFAAALMTIERDGDLALTFWKAANSGGFDAPSETNAHLLIHDLVKRYKGFCGDGGPNGRLGMVGYSIFIYERWAKDRSVMLDFGDTLSAIDGAAYYLAYLKLK